MFIDISADWCMMVGDPSKVKRSKMDEDRIKDRSMLLYQAGSGSSGVNWQEVPTGYVPKVLTIDPESSGLGKID